MVRNGATLIKGNNISRSGQSYQEIVMRKKSIQAFLNDNGSNLTTQIVLDSLGITKLTHENWEYVMGEIMKRKIFNESQTQEV